MATWIWLSCGVFQEFLRSADRRSWFIWVTETEASSPNKHHLRFDRRLGALVTGDFNGDGIPDLASTPGIITPDTSAQIIVFLGNGDGTFGAALTTSFSWSFTAVICGLPPPIQANLAAADLNHDGNLDLVMAVENQLAVLLGNGSVRIFKPCLLSSGRQHRDLWIVSVWTKNHIRLR